MPTYIYECLAAEDSHGEFEIEHKMSEKLEKCPHCKDAGKDSDVKRLIANSTPGKVELTRT